MGPLFYAKVDVRGILVSRALENDEFMRIDIPRPERKYVRCLLDTRKLTGWTEEQLDRLNGRTARVTGTLASVRVKVRPGVWEERLAIIARTLERMDEDEENNYRGPVYEKP